MKDFPLSHFSDNRGSAPHIKSREGIGPRSSYRSLCAGFTLVEMVVVAAIIGFLSTILITNFSRTRIDIDQSANLIMATIREAQSKTVSSTIQYNNQGISYNPCGYGIHYDNATKKLAIYIGPDAASPTNCITINKNYISTRDTLLPYLNLTDSKVEIKNAVSFDIFFLPPDPKTYLNNNSSLNQITNPPIVIQVGQIGVACPTNCRTISVYSSGLIESQ